jgi:protocatechuate 3,4-dioxygenase beta subunit
VHGDHGAHRGPVLLRRRLDPQRHHRGPRGHALRLGLRVLDAESCEPIANAIVDIWHCDATGLYSGFESASTGGGPGGGGSGPTDEKTYLRGARATNNDGIVEFETVYPGWYRGRTVHIHAKVHLDKQTVLTSRLTASSRC